MKFANIINMHMENSSPSPAPNRPGQRMLIKAIIMLSLLICLPGAQGSTEAARSMILESRRINEKTFQTQTKTQSKQTSLTAPTTATKSLALILAATQITNHQTEKAVAMTAATPRSAHSFSAPNGSLLGNKVAINNISNNGDDSTMATNVPIGVEANLIISNRNVQDEQDSIEHNATMSSTESSTSATTTTTSTTTTTARPTTTRRPAPTTTLKPPPTIDDYQTIISQAGTHAYLPCNVKQLVKKPISWLRMRDGHILTVDQTTFIADQRFQSVFSPNPERWSLQIKYVQLKDEGTYECQVSTEPKASAIVHLRIVEPKTELIGESTRHVKAGSQVKLRCIISQALEPPLFINWFYNQKQIYLHNRRGWRTEIERIDLPAEAPTTPTTTTTTTSTTTTPMPTTTKGTSATSPTASAAATEASNGLLTITRSFILDAISVIDGGDAIAEITTPTTSTEADSHGNVTSATFTPTSATLIAAAAAGATSMSTPATTTATTGMPTTTTTTEAATTPTTTLVPSSSFIKQITTASLIIPAVVKQDSGNYTCSPSNSAPRTIVLHVLNGEYSASAIKSAGNTLIGCRSYLQWHSVSTILTLLWIIKFTMTRNMTVSMPAAATRTCTQSQGRMRLLAEGRHGASSISGAKVVEDKT